MLLEASDPKYDWTNGCDLAKLSVRLANDFKASAHPNMYPPVNIPDGLTYDAQPNTPVHIDGDAIRSRPLPRDDADHAYGEVTDR